MKTTVTGKNQASIPAALARRLGIHPGTRLEWSVASDDSLVVKVLPDRRAVLDALAGAGRPYLVDGADPVAELVEARAADE